MTDTAALANLLSYSAQVLVVVAVGGVAHAALRLNAPSVSYGYWRAVLGLCLALPWLQGRADLAARGSAGVTTEATVAMAGAAAAVPRSVASSIDVATVVAIVLAAGVVARLAWLAVSAVRLRRLRSAGLVVAGESAYDDIQRLLGTQAEIRLVNGLGMPLTFGALRPVVLLPADIGQHPEAVQRAAVTHELLHVQRRDWLWHLAEEAVLAVLWFNPAVWWLVSRIRFAREAAVDEMTVLVTGRRRTYIEALLAFARCTPAASAAPFARRRHLFLRIQALSKEAFMSSRRVVLTSALLVGFVGVAGYYAVDAFPLSAAQEAIQTAPGPLEQRSNPITPENPIPRRTNVETPIYPDLARASDASGTVTLRVTLDDLGRVAEVRATSISIRARLDAVSVSVTLDHLSPADLQVISGQARLHAAAMRATIQAFVDAATNAVRQWRYDPPAAAPISFPVTVTFSPSSDPVAVQNAAPPPMRSNASGGVWAEGAIRVGGNIKAPTKIKDVRPEYPAVAQQARVSGMVIVEALVGPDGSVQDAKVLKSIPLLDQAAIEAVLQWRFTPTLLNGVPVPVIMTVTVNFTLQPGILLPDLAARAPSAAPALDAQWRRPSTYPELVKEVKPRYTAEAMRAGVEGTVELEVTIGTDGKVVDARILRSLPLLDESALWAVRQWQFRPIPKPFTTTVELSFVMRGNK